MADLLNDVEAYAALAVALSEAGADRAALLAEHGLDEESWDAIDDAWNARLADVPDDADDEGIPALLLAHAEAFAEAQHARSRIALPFERFVEVTRAMRRGVELPAVLRRFGLTFEDWGHAEKYWTTRLLQDDDLAARFDSAMR